MSAWDKLVFGWLDYQLVDPGDRQDEDHARPVGGAEQRRQAGGGRVAARPDRRQGSVGTPFAGSKFYYSSTGNDMDNAMVKPVTLPTGAPIADREGALQHRGGLGLRVRDRLDRRRRALRRPSTRTSRRTTQPERAELRRGDHRRLDGDRLGRPDGRSVRVRGPDRQARVRVLDRRRAGGRPRPRRTRASRSTTSRSPVSRVDGAETDAGWTFDPADGWLPRHDGHRDGGRTSTPTSSRTGSTSARTCCASASTARSAWRRTTSAARSARTGPSGIRTRTAC